MKIYIFVFNSERFLTKIPRILVRIEADTYARQSLIAIKNIFKDGFRIVNIGRIALEANLFQKTRDFKIELELFMGAARRYRTCF